eukprot:TRINITY_DN1814_c0_g2_i1.p1 TRINITY_DN1814_c0_g2~~TRINITY_DN1814_c0_g2_i1.p1  ORF type:complete len:107 (+),score=4.96 TRINITY_DN1814_c0_g2_i1:208-528(+)
MKFCSECNNLLYPKELKEEKTLTYACRNCNHIEPATDNRVYHNQVSKSNEKTEVVHDVAADPTLPRTKAKECPECGNREAVFFQAKDQEGMALYFVCSHCTCRWKG